MKSEMFHAQARSILAVLTGCIAMQSASAQIWSEVGDAGQGGTGTAQAVVGVGPVSTITGTFSGVAATVPDMYLIFITSPATFSATMTLGGDTQIFLFNPATGLGIAGNDDAIGLLSQLPVGNPLYSGLAAGLYVLGISIFDNDPISSGGEIFPDTFSGVQAATGPGGPFALTGFNGVAASAAAYSVTLTGVGIPPAPPSVALLALAAMAGLRRRRET